MFSEKLIFDTFLSSLRSLEALWGLLGGSFGRLLRSLELFRGSLGSLGVLGSGLWAPIRGLGRYLGPSFCISGVFLVD